MPLSTLSAADEFGHARSMPNAIGSAERAASVSSSAVSWGAVLAGAAAAAALSLILLLLGTGLGLSSVSPWAQSGVTATTFGVSTIIWITVTQLLASGMGGYLAGRLRTKSVAVHTDEVYFRDAAHGFLAWAIASLATAALLGSVIGLIVGTRVQAGASAAGGAVTAATTGAAAAAGAAATKAPSADGGGPMAYLMDSMFRKDASAAPAPAGSGAATSMAPSGNDAPAGSTAEVARIFMNSIGTGELPANDLRNVAQVVAQRTGLSQADAEKRVSDAYAKAQTQLRDAQTAAKQAADTARKTSAYAALWLFISLLIGAFCASYAATMGGRTRDA